MAHHHGEVDLLEPRLDGLLLACQLASADVGVLLRPDALDPQQVVLQPAVLPQVSACVLVDVLDVDHVDRLLLVQPEVDLTAPLHCFLTFDHGVQPLLDLLLLCPQPLVGYQLILELILEVVQSLELRSLAWAA